MSAIEVLLTQSRPAAIVGGVGTVVVDAVDAVGWAGASSHVGEKGGVIVPAFADLDSATSVVSPARTFGVGASIANVAPSFPLWRQSVPMRALSLKTFCSQASARLCATIFQQKGESEGFVSAITDATPSNMTFTNVGKGKDEKATEALTSDIFKSGHNGSLHERLCQAAVKRYERLAAALYHSMEGGL